MSKQAAVVGEVVASDVHQFSTGVKVKFSQVPQMMVLRIQEAHPIPEIYKQSVPGRNGQNQVVDNPNHPDYLERKQQAENIRTLKILETMILVGVDLVDGLPKSDAWLRKLETVMNFDKYYTVDDSGVRTMSDDAKKLVYIMNVAAVTGDDFALISRNTGLTEDRVAEDVASF